jgi:uncharacterized protein (DUF2147 family)
MLHNQLMFKFLILFFLTGFTTKSPQANNADKICGKWISSSKNIIVLVYREGNTFKGKMVWYKNTDTSKGMDEWTDKHNPDPALRNRKILGLNILKEMTYSPGSDSWENGKIYDIGSGHEYSAAAHLGKDGVLKVTGYWHFKFIGRTMTFIKA